MKKTIVWLVAGCVFMMPFLAGAATLRDQMEEIYANMPQVFPDLPKDHINYIAVNFLYEDEVIGGYPDGTFKPDGQINRAELMKMVVARLYPGDMEVSDDEISKYQGCFPDVGDEWFAYYVCKGKEKGWVDGYPDGTFKPGNNVNRVEAIKIVLNALIAEELWPTPTDAELNYPIPADAEDGAWYSGYLRFAIAKELLDGEHVTGDETAFYYKPGEPMTRKEVAEMVYRVWMYMTERVEYAELIVDGACLFLENADLTEDEQAALWEEGLNPIGYSLDDVGTLTLKYESDDVLNAMIADGTALECGDASSVDMTKWDGFMLFAR